MAPSRSISLVARVKRVRLLLLDVDGVMTDGRLYYGPGPDGAMVEAKGFDTQDGVALIWAHEAGMVNGLISGRDPPGRPPRGPGDRPLRHAAAPSGPRDPGARCPESSSPSSGRGRGCWIRPRPGAD